MNWAERTTEAEAALSAAEQRRGLTGDVVRDLAIAAVYALLAINDGLDHIWQEVRKP